MTGHARRRATAAAIIAAALLFTACGNAPGSPGQSASGAVVLPRSPTALPQFSPAQFKRLLFRLRGKPVVVNFWASWCGPCKAEAPGLASEARALSGRAQFLGVDILDQRQPARAFIQTYGWPYPSVFDPTGAIRDDLGFIGQPVTVVYDGSGKRVLIQSGPIPEDVLRKAVEDALQA